MALLLLSILVLFIGFAFVGSAGHPSRMPSNIDPGLDPQAIEQFDQEWAAYRLRARSHEREFMGYAKLCFVAAVGLFGWFLALSARSRRSR